VVDDFGAGWADTVRSVCDPVFESADVRFSAQVMMRGAIVDALLWEADPDRFAKRYPDSGLVESYGSGWPPPCVDFWAYIRPSVPCAVLNPEGWGHQEIVVQLCGDALSDGRSIGREFARILRVTEPVV
jgi:hypothetical protein